MRLAPTSSISESATSPTTSTPRSTRWRSPPAVPRPASLSGVRTSPPARCSAGASPNSSAAPTDTASENSSTGVFNAICASSGMVLGGTIAMMPRSPATASTTPTAPPQPASTMLSASNCRTSRERCAPSAPRIAISRRR